MVQQLASLPEETLIVSSKPDYTVLQLTYLIRKQLTEHLTSLDLNSAIGNASKDLIRQCHALHRAQFYQQEEEFLKRCGRGLLHHFASGEEIDPERVDPYLCVVTSETEDSRLFRLATFLWSVPVSRGYGRRMRFLVRDRSNGKLIGLFGLTDPVFNLGPRDAWIGWNADDRKQRLVNVMDAHVVGAVPPYSTLLGGKLVASLMTSQDVCDAFAQRYEHRTGIISQENKDAHLLLLTVTSALGRSSLYNRLQLQNVMRFHKIGLTSGWGHFHIPQPLFQLMRELLRLLDHPYASSHRFGQGPNWRLRVIKKSLEIVGLDKDLLKHGIQREIYGMPMVEGWQDYLCGRNHILPVPLRPHASELGHLAIQRWLLPRSRTRPEFRHWTREDTWAQLTAEQY